MNSKSTIDISKIESKFGGSNLPKDEFLLELFKKAYKKELNCFVGKINIEGIKPYSSFKPIISKEFRNYFENTEKKGSPPKIFVYQKGSSFVMSDDYNAYYLYLEKKYKEIICIILGESNSKYILEKSEPFILPQPTIEILNDNA